MIGRAGFTGLAGLALLGCVAPADDSGPVDDRQTDTAPADSAPVDTDTGLATVGGDTADSAPDTSDEPLPLCINEFMPDNASSAYDESGVAEDWVELHNPGTEDIDLDGWTLTDDPANTNKSKLPGGILPAGGYALLWASGAAEEVDDHLSFRLPATGGTLGVYAPDGRGSLITYGSVQPDFSIARTTNCCTGDGCLDYDFRGTPGYSNEPLVYEEAPFVGPGSTWRYAASGTVDADWNTVGYNDSDWIDGEAPLGYGATQATVIPYGDDAANKWPTAWFRLYFVAEDLANYPELTLSLRRDDGAVIYLNGIELLRDNLPEGEVTPTTLATASTGSEDTWFDYTLDPAVLLEGGNQLAVEVHQASVDSDDLVFDLSLTGRRVVE